MVSSLRRRWGAQPQVGARLRAELPGPALYFLEEAGPTNLANGVWPTTSGGVRVGTTAGLARATAGSSYPIWATQPSFQSAKKSAVVYLIPRQGTPPGGSRRVISDYNGTTYSFVITFDAGVIGLFCHNGTTGGAATWSTTVTVGQPMCIVGVADGTTIYLYVDGQLRASAALSGSLRAVTDGVAIGGNPAGASPDILNADFLFALQLPYAIAAPMAREISLDPALVFAPRRIWVPVSAGGSDIDIAGVVGNAVASGVTGAPGVSIDIAGAVGNAVAVGIAGSAQVATEIAGSVGNAVAAGVAGSASVTNDINIDGIVGNAVAAGIAGDTSVGSDISISGTVGNAVSAGTAGVPGVAISVAASVGNATAAGVSGLAAIGVPIDGAVGNAAAAGITGTLTLDIVVAGVVASAVAAGVTGSASVDAAAVSATPGYTIAAKARRLTITAAARRLEIRK